MPRLRHVSVSSPGFSRRRRGMGWSSLDTGGGRIVAPDVIAGISALAIPPAQTDVWSCRSRTDDRGRRQYRYHEQWRLEQDRAGHERVLEVAARLPVPARDDRAGRQRQGLPDLARHRPRGVRAA